MTPQQFTELLEVADTWQAPTPPPPAKARRFSLLPVGKKATWRAVATRERRARRSKKLTIPKGAEECQQ